MNKTQRAKGIAKFFLLTTPAIALVLFGIQQVLAPSPVATYYGATKTIPATKPQISRIDELLPVPNGFQSVAEIRFSQDFTRGTYRQRNVIVRFPPEASRKDIDNSLRIVAREAFEGGANLVVVSGQHLASVNGELKTMWSELTFAPGGDTSRTNRVCELSEYKVVIEHGFVDEPADLEMHVKVRIVNTDSDQPSTKERK